MTFESLDYEPLVVSGLLLVAKRPHATLRVVDFGGSLGSSFFQHRTLLDELGPVEWDVVEQPRFVECGREQNHDPLLRFHETVPTGQRDTATCTMALFSGVLSWVAEPFVVLTRVLAEAPDVVVIDRTVVNGTAQRRYHVQTVPSRIYPASYPVSSLPERGLVSTVTDAGYRLVARIDRRSAMTSVATIDSEFMGYLFESRA